MPTFPALNGHVKTPLRLYPDIHMASWVAFPCRDVWADVAEAVREQPDDGPYALVSPRKTMPPFQFTRTVNTASTIVGWKIYDLDGALLLDITSSAGAIVKVPLIDEDRYLYFGASVLGILPARKQYCQITFNDGLVYTSELYLPTCDEGDDDTYLDQDFAQTLFGWGVGSSINEADNRIAVAGAPSDPAPYEGKKTINQADAKLYTYTGGSWVQSTPSNGNYRFLRSTGEWWQWTTLDGWGLMGNPGFDAPPFVTGPDGTCFEDNPDGLGLALDTLDGASIVDEDTEVTVRVCVGSFTAGTLEVTVGGTTHTITDQAGGCFSFAATYPAGATQYIAIAPTSPAFDGCLLSALVLSSASDTSCNLVLEWEDCGNVGTMYYESGFVNKFYLPLKAEVVRPTAVINIDASEDGDGGRHTNRFRKEIDWTLPVGRVPWHVADALTEIAGHDQVRLVHKLGLGSDAISNVRVEQVWEDEDEDCLCSVTITFQVDEATVGTGCCDEFLPPCDEDLDPGSITSFACYGGDCSVGYVFTASIPAGYRGQLMVSTDGGITYENTDLDLTSAEWAANTIPVDPVEGIYLIRVYYADCEVGVTPDWAPCGSGYPFRFDSPTAYGDPGAGRFLLSSSTVASVIRIYVDNLDANGTNRTSWLDAASGQLHIVPVAGGTTTIFNVSSVSADVGGGFRILVVTYVSGPLPTDEALSCLSYGH